MPVASHCVTQWNMKAVSLRQEVHTMPAMQRLPALHRRQGKLVLAVTQPVQRPKLKGQL